MCILIKELIIPNNVEEIKQYAFYNNILLNKLILSNSIKTIYKSAFEKCTSLQELNIPNNIDLKERCFADLFNINKINISKKYENKLDNIITYLEYDNLEINYT